MRTLHVLGSAQREAVSIVEVVKALGSLSDPTCYRHAAWFVRSDGPLRERLEEVGVETAYVPWSGGTDVGGARSLVGALRRFPFDIIHCHTGGRALLWLLRLGTSAKVILHVHGPASEDRVPTPPFVLSSGAHRVIVNSAATGERVRRQALVVHPGLDSTAYLLSNRPEAAPPVVGAATRLVPIKGVVHLIRAMPGVLASFPDAFLEIAGDGSEAPALRLAVEQLGIGRSVSFLGWEPDLRPRLATWTVFVQPSIEEPFGFSVVEAMASGLPVVASAVGGLREVVVPGRTGVLVPPADPAALAESITTMLADRRRARQLGLEGRRRVQEHFSSVRMVAEISALYDSLAGSSR